MKIKLNNAFDKLKEEHEALKKEFKENENKLKEELDTAKKEIREMSKYMKDILKLDEEDEKELQKYECIREKHFKQKEEEEGNIIKENNTPQGKFISSNIFIINLLLYKEKIK